MVKMLRNLFIIAYISFFIKSDVNCARILGVFPTPSFSHQVVFRPIVNELAKRGHELVVLTTDPQRNASIKNLREIDLHSAYEFWDLDVLHNANKLAGLFELHKIYDMMRSLTEHEYQLPEVQELLNSNEKFDLAFIELFPQALPFAVRFNCPHVGIISMDAISLIHDYMGNPTHPVAYPDIVLPFKLPLTFPQRIGSVLMKMVSRLISRYIFIDNIDYLFKKHFGPNMPSIDEVSLNTSLLLLNSNPVLHNIRPLGPNTIQIGGGAHLTPLKPLPKDIKHFLDKSKNGAIYFSLGTNVKSTSMTSELKKMLIDTFRDLQYNVLWKFDIDIPEKSDNVKIISWAPQQDILRHPNIKLFITQGGLQSTEEAIFSHVPMLCLPFFGDQVTNARIVEEKGMGVTLDKDTVDKNIFKSTILEVIENPRYKKKVEKIAELLADQQVSGVDKAVWWIEYVIRHKGAYHLQNPVTQIPFYQYYLLDVISFLTVIFIIVTYINYKLLKFIIGKCKRSVKQKTQ